MSLFLFIIACAMIFALIIFFEFFGWILTFIFKIIIGFPLFCIFVYWIIEILRDGGFF